MLAHVFYCLAASLRARSAAALGFGTDLNSGHFKVGGADLLELRHVSLALDHPLSARR